MSDMDELFEEEIRAFDIDYADGTTAEVGVIAQFEIEFEELGTRQEYIVITELVDGHFPEAPMEVMPYRYFADPLKPELFRLGDVESEEEFEIVMNTFDEIMAEDDEEPIDQILS